ncbi:integrin alpha-5-like [Branchiostoma floridae]|uniref:Integrin alpha-5-like n=1 Tax=Branchiostoma floridae TaxID=7739 RepID=A0A9J7N4X9_BRAFL|nr:integrin alpha-5-like [Branchiostoma floridae]
MNLTGSGATGPPCRPGPLKLTTSQQHFLSPTDILTSASLKPDNMAAQRFDFCTGILCFFVTVLVHVATSFNIDTRTPIIRRGPYGSYFGFSVDLHREGDKTWMLVGAPRAQTRQPGTDRPGAVYMCNIDYSKCVQIPFDTTGSDRLDGSLTLYKEDKSFQWFGASLKSSGPNGPVVVSLRLS